MTFERDLHLRRIPCTACPGGFLYSIEPGDTFFGLAQTYGLTVQDLITANPDADPNNLQIGQEICIPKAPAPPERGCTLILKSRPEGPAPNAAGVLFLQNSPGNKREILIAATGLPSPTTIRANRYTSVFTWGKTTFHLPLLPVPGISGLWVGNSRESFPPEFFSGNVDIYPGPILTGLITNCR